jgi:dTDP-4-amino-4,6-dideoxygalactose transaminase
MSIAFIDLAAQQKRLRANIDAAIARVLDEGRYIMGPQVKDLEGKLAAFCGAKHCITCANGTDALQLALMALNVKAKDAVFVPAFTFAATAEIVPLLGAVPVFVDCLPETFNMDPESLKRAVARARELDLNPAAVIPVDLFGLPADYDAISEIARENGMKIVADSAQGFGSVYKGRKAGVLADLTTTSFFPAKPLGCYGDGGAVFTDDDELAALVESFRVHGKGKHKYYNDRIGANSRLDTIQARDPAGKTRRLFRRDRSAPEGCGPLQCGARQPLRDASRARRAAKRLGPVHHQAAFRGRTGRAAEPGEGKRYPDDGLLSGSAACSECLRALPGGSRRSFRKRGPAEAVLSLPMHPYLTDEDQRAIIAAIT